MFEIEKYKKILDDYANKYINLMEKKEDKTLISFKLSHTYRVTSNMEKIAKSCNLNEHDMFIAKVIGMYHDIGRFKQYFVYKTYDDKKSVNHAIYSTEVLKENDILRDFNEEDRNIIYKSIYYHTVYKIEAIDEELTKNEVFFLKMIRDADRLDIYDSMANRVPNMSKEEQYIWYNERDLDGDVSDNIYNQIKEKVSPSMKECSSVAESIFARFSWVFSDFSFKEAINIIVEGKYFEKVYNYMKKSNKINELYLFIMDYIQKIMHGENNLEY